MIHTAGTDKIEPFNVGVSISNTPTDIAKYNVFIIILQDISVQNAKIACVYNRISDAPTQNYAQQTFNSSYEYWNWFSITLNNNTFSYEGSYGTPRTGSSAGTKYENLTAAAIYGIV